MTPKVLIVDDDIDLTKAISIHLENKGFDTITALSYETALPLLSKYKIGVAIIDIKLSGKNGIDLVKILKDINPICEIIILTGLELSFEDTQFLLSLGIRDLVKKPIDQIFYNKVKQK